MIEEKLNTLFKKYESTFQNEYLNEIIERGYVFSDVNVESDILICGINPSYRKLGKNIDQPTKNYSYKFKDTENDRYFKKYHHFFSAYKHEHTIDYLDFFYQRHTQQKDFKLFFKEERSINFLTEQLQITQETLELIEPKAIFLFNRFASNFLGKNNKYNFKNETLTNVWLGYIFENTPIPNTYKIKGFIDLNQRIGNKKQTNLKGTIVYFSRFLNHYVKQEEISQIQEDIDLIIKQI